MTDYQVPAVGIGLLVIGAIGPWAKVLSFTQNGLDADGVLTLGLAVVAAVFVGLAFRAKTAPNKFALGVPGALCLAIAILDIIDVKDAIDEIGSGFEASVGWGLWMTLVGSIVLVAAAVMQFRKN
jgi:hypothetical protein